MQYLTESKVLLEKSGDSLGFQLPKEIVEKENIQENQEIKVIISDQKQATGRVLFVVIP